MLNSGIPFRITLAENNPMITCDQIRKKAERLYPKVVRAWLEGDSSFFPRTLPSPKSLDNDDISSSIRAVQQLRNGSKETLGYGFTVEWTSRRSRRFGQNDFPHPKSISYPPLPPGLSS